MSPNTNMMMNSSGNPISTIPPMMVQKAMITNDHFQKDLRRFNGNNASAAAASGFYQRASHNVILKKSNQCISVTNFENDHWHPTPTGPRFQSPCSYQNKNAMKITKRSNYVGVKLGSMENDQWNGITSTSRPHSAPATVTPNVYKHAALKKITKRSNQMKLSKLESDQWSKQSQSMGYNMALPIQECGMYNRKNTKVIVKKANKVMKLAPMESDQWHPSSNNMMNNKRYNKFEERKANKPWHAQDATEKSQPLNSKSAWQEPHQESETDSTTTDEDEEEYISISVNDIQLNENQSPSPARMLLENKRYQEFNRSDSKGNLATSVSEEMKTLSDVGRTCSNSSLSKLAAGGNGTGSRFQGSQGYIQGH